MCFVYTLYFIYRFDIFGIQTKYGCFEGPILTCFSPAAFISVFNYKFRNILYEAREGLTSIFFLIVFLIIFPYKVYKRIYEKWDEVKNSKNKKSTIWKIIEDEFENEKDNSTFLFYNITYDGWVRGQIGWLYVYKTIALIIRIYFEW